LVLRARKGTENACFSDVIGCSGPLRRGYAHDWFPSVSTGSIERMGAADFMLFALLALADACLLTHLHRRRQRRMKVVRMMQALQSAIRREVGVRPPPVVCEPALVLQQAS